MDLLLEGEVPFIEVEQRLRKKDGEWLWILEHAKVIVRDEDGNSLDIEDLVTITPITGEVEISEDANKFSKREINRLVELVKKKTNS